MSLQPAVRARIESLLAGNRAVLFMKGQPSRPQCGFSAKASAALQDLGIEFAHVDVLLDPDLREGIKLYGNWPTIPQLYVNGELIGGSDIILQMADSGELAALFGLPEPDRTAPNITITPAALEKLKGALAQSPGSVLRLRINAQFQPDFQFSPLDNNAIAVETGGLRVQFDPASARRADGITIDWVSDLRGEGLAVDNPHAPGAQSVPQISVHNAAKQINEGTLTLVDVRPPEERALASVNVPFETFDGDNRARLENLPKATPLAFMCHGGGRASRATQAFRELGFSRVYNLSGGIVAWAKQIDHTIPEY